MSDCVFCKITKGEAPATIRYEDDDIIAFDDINPKAPVHVLIVPKEHIESTRELTEKYDEMVGKMVRTAPYIAEKLDIIDSGYKLIINTGKEAGQLVDHLHIHLLGGKTLERLEV